MKYQPIEGDSKIRRILFNEVTAVVALVSVVVGVMNWVNNPNKAMDKNIALIQKDIKTINENHLTHLQNYAEEIRNLKIENEQHEEEINAQNIRIERILTILENKK